MIRHVRGERPGRAGLRRPRRTRSSRRRRASSASASAPSSACRWARPRAGSSTSTTAARGRSRPADLEFLTARRPLRLAGPGAHGGAGAHVRRPCAARDERLDALQGELLRHEIVGAAPALLQAYDAAAPLRARAARACCCAGRRARARSCSRAPTRRTAAARRGSYVPVTIPALAPTPGGVGAVRPRARRVHRGHARQEGPPGGRARRRAVPRRGRRHRARGADEAPALPRLRRAVPRGRQRRRARWTRWSSPPPTARSRRTSSRAASAPTCSRGSATPSRIPPLRERPERTCPGWSTTSSPATAAGRRARPSRPRRMDVLRRHHWPFNVRELQQVVERAVCLVDGDVVAPGPARLPAGARPAPPPPARPRRSARPAEQGRRGGWSGAHIVRALEYTKGNKRRGDRAAPALAGDVLPAARGVRAPQEGRVAVRSVPERPVRRANAPLAPHPRKPREIPRNPRIAPWHPRCLKRAGDGRARMRRTRSDDASRREDAHERKETHRGGRAAPARRLLERRWRERAHDADPAGAEPERHLQQHELADPVQPHARRLRRIVELLGLA